MLTPIFIDFSEKELYQTASNYLNLDAKDPVDLYSEDLDPVSNTKERILAPRYYVIIHGPNNNYQAPKKFNIEKAPHSIGKNTLRTTLTPSFGYGINACYKVEFWEWYPLLNSTATISKKKVHTEYWYVPTINNTGYYIPNNYYNQSYRPWPHSIESKLYSWRLKNYLGEYYWPYYYPRTVVKEFVANRVVEGDYVYDDISTKDALPIITFTNKEDSVQILSRLDTFTYNTAVKDWTFSTDTYGVRLKRLISVVNGLEQIEPETFDNVTIKVRYYLPFHPSDMTVNEQYLDQYI